MILINVPDPNLAIEYLRAFIDDESSFNELRDLIADKSYALSICCTVAYSDTISMITTNVKLMVMRGNKIDPVPQPAATRGLLVNVDVKPTELRTTQRLSRLLNTMMVAHDKLVMDVFAHLVVHLPSGGYGATEFDMSDSKREALVAAGRNAMNEYLDRPSPAAIPGETAAYEQAQAKTAADRIALNILRAE